MDGPSLVSRAKAGDAAAIAALINRTLQPQGFQVEGDRQGSTLTLWISGPTLPPEEATVAYLQRGLEKLQISHLREAYVYGSADGSAGATQGGAGERWRRVLYFPGPGFQQGSQPGSQPAPQQGSQPPIESVDRVPLAPASATTPATGPKDSDPSPDAVLVTLPPQGADNWRRVAPPAPAETMEPLEPPVGLEALSRVLARQGLTAQVTLHRGQLQIVLPAARSPAPLKTLALVYTCLVEANLQEWGLAQVDTYVVRGLGAGKQVRWRRQAPMPRQDALSTDNTDLFSFHNRYANVYIFPGLLVIGAVLGLVPVTAWLLRGIRIWIHEFGHATIAWLSGRQAIPLPIGWTSYSLNRSIFVYLGLLILFGLLYWSGWRERKVWPRVLAVVLVVLQFFITWILDAKTTQMLITFGGIGGEFYLSTLLMVSFYFPLPNYWRWDAYRYPAVLGAAFCFWQQVGLWWAIAQGRASIPWGALWGGEDSGDMNKLVNLHGWSPDQLVGTYNTISVLCLGAIAAVYFYRCWREHYRTLWSWWLQGIARWS